MKKVALSLVIVVVAGVTIYFVLNKNRHTYNNSILTNKQEEVRLTCVDVSKKFPSVFDLTEFLPYSDSQNIFKKDGYDCNNLNPASGWEVALVKDINYSNKTIIFDYIQNVRSCSNGEANYQDYDNLNTKLRILPFNESTVVYTPWNPQKVNELCGTDNPNTKDVYKLVQTPFSTDDFKNFVFFKMKDGYVDYIYLNYKE